MAVKCVCVWITMDKVIQYPKYPDTIFDDNDDDDGYGGGGSDDDLCKQSTKHTQNNLKTILILTDLI